MEFSPAHVLCCRHTVSLSTTWRRYMTSNGGASLGSVRDAQREAGASMPQLNHAGITVSDLEDSIAFYCDVVGFDLSLRTRTGGDWFDTLTHNAGAEIEIAMLTIDGFTLQLVQYHRAGGEPLALAHHHIGSPHLCIEVDDVDRRHAAISATGE